MKRSFILSGIILSLFLISPAFAGSTATSGPTPAGQTPVQTPLTTRTMVRQNSILGVEQGIKYNQQSSMNRYFGSSINNKPNQGNKPSQDVDKPDKPNIPPRPPVYYSGGYWYNTWDRYGRSDNGTTVNNTTNNIYVNQSDSDTNANNNNDKKAEEQTKKEPTQKELDERERQLLKSKYSAILANKTATNRQMCTTMASFFPNHTAEELDRVLNDLLYLNCDINELRSDSIQNKIDSMFGY